MIDQDLRRLVSSAVSSTIEPVVSLRTSFEGQSPLAEGDPDRQLQLEPQIHGPGGRGEPDLRGAFAARFRRGVGLAGWRRQRRNQIKQYGSKSDDEWW